MKTLVGTLCGIISHVFVNRNINTLTVSNVALAFPVVGVLNTFKVLMKRKATTCASVLLKGGGRRGIHEVLPGTVCVALFLCVLVTLSVVLFLRPVLGVFKNSRTAVPCTGRCLRVLVPNGVLLGVDFSFGGVVHTTKRPVQTVCALLVNTTVGIVLSPVFVF